MDLLCCGGLCCQLLFYLVVDQVFFVVQWIVVVFQVDVVQVVGIVQVCVVFVDDVVVGVFQCVLQVDSWWVDVVYDLDVVVVWVVLWFVVIGVFDVDQGYIKCLFWLQWFGGSGLQVVCQLLYLVVMFGFEVVGILVDFGEFGWIVLFYVDWVIGL